MNISLRGIKNIFTGHQDRDVSKAEFNPYRDWKIVLLFGFAAFAAVVVFHTYLFFSIQKDTFLKGSTAPAAEVELNRKSLESVIEVYKARAVKLDLLLNSRAESYTEVADPSR